MQSYKKTRCIGMIQNSKLVMWEQGGQIFLKTQETEKPVTPKTLLLEIQKNFFIDFGIHPLKTIRSREVKGDICPYCGSKETIGHGSRTTQTELQIRRWCNSCNRTFIAGKEPVPDHEEDKKRGSKGTIKFLHLLGYNRQDIADRLGLSWSAVNASVKKLEAEQEIEFLQSYYIKHEISKDELADLEIKTTRGFPLKNLIKDTLGHTNIWDYDGRLALQNKKISDKIVFISKENIKLMLALDKTKNVKCLNSISSDDRDVIINYIEDRKDDMLGILPKTHIFTKVAEDAGELDAELMESSAHKEESETEQ